MKSRSIIIVVILLVCLFALYVYLKSSKSSYSDIPLTKGICYQFYNNKDPNTSLFPDMICNPNWNATRANDLSIIKTAGVLCLRTYEFGWDQSHDMYFGALESSGLQTNVPISNYNITNVKSGDFSTTYFNYLGKEFTSGKQYRKCIHSIMVANEPELMGKPDWATTCVQYMQAILDAENKFGIQGSLPLITVPVSFTTRDPSTGKTGIAGKVILDELEAEMKNQGLDVKLGSRYIGSINTTNPPSDIKTMFDAAYQKPFMLTEYSPGSDKMTSDNITSYLTDIQTVSNVRAIFSFQYFDPTNKTGAERNFAMTCFESQYEIPGPCTGNTCPPSDAKIGNKFISAVSTAFKGGDVNSLFGIKCGTPGPSPTPSSQVCLPLSTATSDQLQGAINYACGQINCSASPCTQNAFDNATYVFSKYYNEKSSSGATCDFGGIAKLMNSSDSKSPQCISK
jgi:hypothetical protein